MFDLDKFLEKFFTDKPATKEDWERVYKSMIVHTRGVKPKELLEIKRPNEPADVREYRLKNYRAITKHGINQAIDSVYRVLSSSNYSIEYSKTLEEYLKETKFKFLEQRQDFHTLFFNTILRIIFDDPNGLLVWMPENSNPDLPPIEQIETEKINVKPVYVCSKDIKHLTDEVLAFLGGQMIVMVPEGNNKFKETPTDYYYICTHDFIYRYDPEWSKEKKKIVWKIRDWFALSYSNGAPNPAKAFPSAIWHRMGGNVVMNENNLRYYDSFYGCYVPFADECICAFSDNQSVRVRYNFPFVTVKGQKCTSCKGSGKINKTGGGTKPCSTCSGNGTHIPFSPMGHYVEEPPSNNDNEAFIGKATVTFETPPDHIMQSSYQVWENLLLKAKETVNLVFIDEAQSGVAKEIDREQKYETLIKITQNFFGLMGWSLEIIEAYKEQFIADRKESIVTEPETFSIKSESQLMQELNDMTQKETPQAFVATTSNMIAEKLYSNNPEAKIIVDILSKWDVLYGKSASSISMYKSTGAATQKDVLRNVHGYKILSTIAMTEDLTKLTPVDIIAKAEAELAKLVPAETLVMPDAAETEDLTDTITSSEDNLGKIPLALQQLALARERAKTANDTDLVNKIGAKMDELLAKI